MHDLLKEIRYALRKTRRSPGFTVVALGLGMPAAEPAVRLSNHVPRRRRAPP